MTQDEQKQLVAREAIKYVVEDAYIGVGSGSTANYFIDELAKIKHRIRGAVASSLKTAERLKAHGIRVAELTSVDEVPVYIDGADETTEHGALIKGGGGALLTNSASGADGFVWELANSNGAYENAWRIGGTGLGVATANAVQVFGQLPDSATNQAAVPGSYSDTITVTVTY